MQLLLSARARALVVGCVLACGATAAHGQAVAADSARWEADIAAFEALDRVSPPPTDGIVFTGSSSIRLWATLTEDFEGLPVVNRGFGGAQVPEVTAFVDRIVTRHRPRQVVIYCGGNDINAGRSAADVVADTRALVKAIHATLPETRIAYISVAPNPARWSQIDTVRAVNRAIAAWMATDPRLTFIDVFTHMLGADGRPKPDIFVDDRLHMNEKGYAIWREVVRPFLK
jgi:lysophospholipase L1-like esterase